MQLPEDFACCMPRELSSVPSTSRSGRGHVQEAGVVEKLFKAMYGTRSAPFLWQKVVGEKMKALDFHACVAVPCWYYHHVCDVFVVVHVDDFLC